MSSDQERTWQELRSQFDQVHNPNTKPSKDDLAAVSTFCSIFRDMSQVLHHEPIVRPSDLSAAYEQAERTYAEYKNGYGRSDRDDLGSVLCAVSLLKTLGFNEAAANLGFSAYAAVLLTRNLEAQKRLSPGREAKYTEEQLKTWAAEVRTRMAKNPRMRRKGAAEIVAGKAAKTLINWMNRNRETN